MIIFGESNLKKDSHARLGNENDYETNGLNKNEAYKQLAGDEFFTVEEFEVF